MINGKKQRLDKTRNRARYSAVKYKAVLSVLKDIRNLAAKMKKLIAKSPQEVRKEVQCLIKKRIKTKLAAILSEQRRGKSSQAQLDMDKLIDEIAGSLSTVDDGMLDLLQSMKLNSLSKRQQQRKRLSLIHI